MTQRQVILEGGLPWGFRMHGGVDLKTSLKISRVNPGSKAAQRGIREGDLLTSINGHSTKHLTNNEAHNLLKNSGSTLTLGLNEDSEGSPKRRQYRTIHQETHQETVKKSSLSYSIKETIETTSTGKENNNEFGTFKTTNEFSNSKNTKQNGSDVRLVTNIPVTQKSTSSSSSSTSTPSTLVPEGRNNISDHAVASRQSSYSNCSSIPDEGLEKENQKRQDYQEEQLGEMNNGEERISKSKKRRQRRKNNLLNRSISSEEEQSDAVEISSDVEKNVSEIKEEKYEKTEEMANERIEILKLKRIEHKYNVESPKEIRIEQIKTSERKLKAKSKSLDDDEILRIQELSEASESEDVKMQSNIIISEASSEENLISDSDSEAQQRTRRALDSISLKLNDDNQIEMTSHISPAEEHALRTFLGGLNLVESPEQSAKELYEQTAGGTDPKAKRALKRKELEEYFTPIAENPRFLDAISEEASDVSDKETPGVSKGPRHIKQCTPEQDLRQVPPPIPPRNNRRNKLGTLEDQVEPSGAVLVETKILLPESVQQTVCTTTVLSPDKEKAEVVYVNDSSESSPSSGDFEEALDEVKPENVQPETQTETDSKNNGSSRHNSKEEITSNSEEQAQLKKDNIKISELNNITIPSVDDIIQVESNESLSATFSSHSNTSKKISKNLNNQSFSTTSFDKAISSQLTPPPTPDDVTAKEMNPGSTKETKSVIFDYTKIPNVLSSKEPEDGFTRLRGGSIDNIASENCSEVDRNVIRGKGAFEDGVEQTNQINVLTTDDEVTKVSVKHQVSAAHTKKKIVNGVLDNLEFRKVKVDEIFKDGDVEVTKDFEEYKTNPSEKKLSSDEDKIKINEEKQYILAENNVKAEKEQEETFEQKKISVNIQNPEKDTVHNEFTENKKDDLQESSVTENIAKDILKPSLTSNEDLIRKENQPIVSSISGKDTQSYMIQTRAENGHVKETIDEKILRHVMMTSKDSNKTDSEKLMAFNNILMLNSEIKDKINKRELIGPAFRKSKSPIHETVPDYTVMMNCEEVPAKTFVQRRVKEFSEESHNFEKATNEESILKHLVIQNGNNNENEESLVTKDLVKSRIKTFSGQEEKISGKHDDTGSVLKKLILNYEDDKDDKNVTKQGYGKKEEGENSSVNTEKVDQRETVIPITVEKLNVIKNPTKNAKNEKIIPVKLEGLQKEYKTADKVEERVIPINVEKINNEEIRAQEKKHETTREESKVNESILRRLISDNSTEKSTVEKESKKKATNVGAKKFEHPEITIPITIERSKVDKNIQTNLKNEKVVPVKVENKQNTSETTDKTVERIIPISITHKKFENLREAYKDLSKSLDSVVFENTNANSERLIPIHLEEKARFKLIPIQQENDSDKLKTKSISKETIIPVDIKKRDYLEQKNVKSVYRDISKSMDSLIFDKTHKNIANNERIIPIEIEGINKLKKTEEKIVDSKKTIIPVINETKDNKDRFELPKDNANITKESLKEVNDCLKNIVLNKNEKTKVNNQKETIIPIKIDSGDNTNNEPITNVDKKPDIPPVPPPRRSRKNVTKKDYENTNLPLKNTVETNDLHGIIQNLNDASQIKEEKNKSEKIDNKNDLKEKIPESKDMTYTNVLSPPRPASIGSDSSDSEESSRCTAKYNPNSSIADVTSITKEEENGAMKQVYEPSSLRSIVLNFFMSLPFGEEILKEIAEVSKRIDFLTNKIPFRGFSASGSDKNNNILAKKEDKMAGPWYTQKDVARNEYGDERHKIMELHEKFLTRRSYSEGDRESKRNIDDDRVIITGIGSREDHVMSPNRLLTIIREEPSESENHSENIFFEDNTNQRLKAKNLGEWLTLARHKSKSTSNLDCTNIPINNLRKTFTNTQPDPAKFSNTRRRSLPQEIYEKQLIDIMEKEREIQRELEKLEDEKRMLRAEIAPSRQREFQVDDFYVSKRGDFAEIRENVDKNRERPTSMPVFPTEFFRQQMYDEYMDKFSEREERKQQKVIKISSSNDMDNESSENVLRSKEITHPIELEQEFMNKVKQKQEKYLQNLADDTDEGQQSETTPNQSDDASEHERADGKSNDKPSVIVLDGDKVKGIETLPKHLQEFVGDLTVQHDNSIWSPGQHRIPQTPTSKSIERSESQNSQTKGDEPTSPIWTPKSANSSPTVERKEFRAVNFQSPVLSRKNRTNSETIKTPDSTSSEPPWKIRESSSNTAINLSSSLDRRLPTSQSSPGFGSFSTNPRLPKAQNPTITLLQKAREGQLPRGAHYIDQDRRPPNDRPPIKYPGEVLYNIRNEYTSESDNERPRKMADLAPRKFEGIGPTSKDGMPLVLRSEVKEKDQSKWYKRMYDTIHKQKPHRDEYVTVRYKQKRAQYPYTSGYLSEPEPGAYDSDFTDYRYQTLDRRRTPQTQDYIGSSSTMPRSVPDKSYSSTDSIRNPQEKYQPGRIENYMPGRSSISEKEAKQWWDEVMDIFDGHLEQQKKVPLHKPKSFINQALKESGYESDSTLIFKRKEETANQLSPKEQKEAYKTIQKGGDVPFQGLRKPAPERPKEPDLPPPPPPPKSQGGVRSQDQESPRKYVENEVTIHYKTPVRTEIKEYVSEDELAHRQAEAMKKIYEEERKRKYFQELQDMKSRRHTDNFIPSQKSPIPLNRYDDFDNLTPTKTRTRSPEPRLVARALYNFVGQTARELTFRKGDLIYVRRQVDKNWYEGELNAMVGLFPVNYVEIVPYESSKITPRKAYEGQARAKYNFLAQTHLELSLAKGELVTITRRVDDNWFEGKIGGRKGIFPVSYVEVLIDPSEPLTSSAKPVASPAAHSLLLNGSAQGKESMGSHSYTPNIPNPITASRDTGFHHAKPVQLSGSGTYSTLQKNSATSSPIDQALHIETQSDPVPYRALYRYAPQNDDELELLEGDTVFVLEKCDDGWYVGSSERTGAFGTFPGNYVERI